MKPQIARNFRPLHHRRQRNTGHNFRKIPITRKLPQPILETLFMVAPQDNMNAVGITPGDRFIMQACSGFARHFAFHYCCSLNLLKSILLDLKIVEHNLLTRSGSRPRATRSIKSHTHAKATKADLSRIR
ncbi:MAG TPA: hypothetical protein VKQ29_11845 [Aliidongia sp.]|nr:hypothetical protein [Aliidongia sp.]